MCGGTEGKRLAAVAVLCKNVCAAAELRLGTFWTDVQKAHRRRSLGDLRIFENRGCSIAYTGLGSGPDTA